MRKVIVFMLIFIIAASAIYASADGAGEKTPSAAEETDSYEQSAWNFVPDSAAVAVNDTVIYGNVCINFFNISQKDCPDRISSRFRITCEKDEKYDFGGPDKKEGNEGRQNGDAEKSDSSSSESNVSDDNR